METEGRVCGFGGGGREGELVRGASPAPGVRARPAAPQHLCIVHCAAREEGGGEGSSPGSGGGAGRGLPRGRGLADTAAGVPAKAVGDAEYRRDNLVAGEGAKARTQGGQPPSPVPQTDSGRTALLATSLPAAAPTPPLTVSLE